jgi:CHAT domain-containing protein
MIKILRISLVCSAVMSWTGLFSQTKLESWWDKGVENAKGKVKRNTTDVWDKKKQDYDESNFNYAISFLDNSGLFENDEKGNKFSSSFYGALSYATNDDKTADEKAYTHLKNGELLMAGNKFGLAEIELKEAKRIFEDYSRTEARNYSQAIADLGLLYQSRGMYTKAVPFNEQALEIRKKGDNKGMLIVSVNNHAVLKKETGNYTEAEKQLKEALEMSKQIHDSLATALVYNNLAMTYVDMNNMKVAEANMLLSLASASLALKENSPNYIKLQINLANIYKFQKKYEESEALYKHAILMKEGLLGTHPDLAHLKRGLAQLYMEMGKTDKVEDLLANAWMINKRKLGEKNPATLGVQQELGNFYRFQERNDKALEMISDVVEKKKEIYGEGHPNYIQALEDLALTQWQSSRYTEAKTNYKKVIDNTLHYINTFFNSLNDNEKTLYWEKTNLRLQRYYAFAHANYANNTELTNELYAAVINTKGFLLNNSSKIRDIISSSTDESLKKTYKQWAENKENLNRAYQLSKEEIKEQRINIDSLKERTDFLERELSQKSAEFKDANSDSLVSYKNVQEQLKAGEAAVEVVQLNEYKNGFTGAGSYIALVIRPDEISLIELGNSDSAAKAISVFRDKIINQKPENEAYSITWKALDKKLAGVNRVYLSLDGAYHQLSINALKDSTGKYLLDKYNIEFVGNTKDVKSVKKYEQLVDKPNSAFLIGNPSYGKSGLIDQLPGTEAEVKNITKLLATYKVKTTTLFGAEATEAKVKHIKSPSIVHIATHGYFLADLSQMETKKVLGVDIAAAKENPLLRSGVLLAGCDNVFDENYRPLPNTENGVLTAFEAMSLNLDKTDLVVLSACETGLGSVKQGEGVYGLQRAFLIAGAKSIVMSLWSVSDEATMELMTHFYTSYAKTGHRHQAFDEALKQLKAKYRDPFFWSAFVMLNR